MKPIRTLLVDDEVELISTLAERLNMRGFDAQWAETGAEAMQKAQDQEFDVAVLDLKMPKVGGLALKEKLQQQYPAMQFIFLTGYGSEEDFKEITRQIGEEFYLVKPIDIDILISRIKAVLNRGKGDEKR
jgi:DNA-binding response OmpR family regulator